MNENGFTRRSLLKAGAAAGALAVGSDPIISRALGAVGGSGKLSDIEHVVILIQENRSFDHYFGTMPGVRGFGEAGAQLAQGGYPVAGFEGQLLPFHLAAGSSPQCFPDITHEWVAQHQSWDEGRMDGFVKTHLADDGAKAGPATMAYYERADIPYYWALAEAFTLCDNYHCSVLGPTDPNRLYSMSGTIDPAGEHGGPLVETITVNRPSYNGRFSWTTMPEQLTAAGVSWKAYSGANLGLYDNPLTFFKNFQTNPALAEKGIAPVYPNDFVADLAAGSLPQVSWINTSYIETEHPGLSNSAIGEHAVQVLLGRLMSHPRLWAKTAVFITWDENGGFFDHVAPPVPPAGTPGEYLEAPDITGASKGVSGPIGLGFRVPMLIASPFSRGGFLCSETFDHTSILRFLEARFGTEVPNLSAWRRASTGDLTKAFNFAAPDRSNPHIAPVSLTPAQRHGQCTFEPVNVPPNSVPVQPAGGSWRTPSG